MPKNLLKILFFGLITFTYTLSSFGQETLYLGPNSIFHVDSTAIIASIGDVNNQSGSGGNIYIHRTTTFRFYGQNWQNATSSPINGFGKVYFIQPQPAPYSGNSVQTLNGGNNSSSFSSIVVDNPNHINLTSTSSKLRDTLRFVNGSVILNKQNLTVGNGNPGTIDGFTENRYVVTNHTNVSDSGYLIRENIQNSSGTVYFPVGYAVNDYTPAGFSNSGNADTFKVRVFPNVYLNGNSGSLDNNPTVGRTWDIKDNTLNGSNLNLNLQHNLASEGSVFNAGRAYHFVSRYAGFTGANGGDTTSLIEWDKMKFGSSGPGSTPGSITTGTSITNAINTTRSFQDTLGYFTKYYFDLTPLPVEIVALKAQWSKNDGLVSWTSVMELNNLGYEVQRSINNFDFVKIGFVPSTALNGNSNSPIHYKFLDVNLKKNTNAKYFYRLKPIDLNGEFTFTPWVKLEENGALMVNINAFPNPTEGLIFLTQSGINNGYRDIKIFDAIGKLIFEKNESGSIPVTETLNLEHLVPGTYHLQVNSANQSRLFKLVIN